MRETVAGVGLMVLGMHRSGTSALSRVLQLAGATIGERVTGASRGNEGGHWEDAFALQIHERLLAAYGSRWDEPFALPTDWQDQAPAIEARDAIAAYLTTTRAPHPCWSVKDPRLCHFGGLWRDAATRTRLPIASLVVVRHPWEVAASLAVRDDMAQGTAQLLWLEHTLSALAIAETVPSRILAYRDLLADWRACTPRIQALVGEGNLDFAGAAVQIDAYLDEGLNHQRDQGRDSDLPADVALVWKTVAALAIDGDLPRGTTQTLKDALSGSVDLLRDHAMRRRRSEQSLLRAIAQSQASTDCTERIPPSDLLPQHTAVLDMVIAGMREQRPSENAMALAREEVASSHPSEIVAARPDDSETRVPEAHIRQGAATRRAIELEARAIAAEQRADAEVHRAIVAETNALSAQARQQLLEERLQLLDQRLQVSESMATEVEAKRLDEAGIAALEIGRLGQRIVDAEARHVRDAVASAELEQREDILHSILSSRSWQVTRPLRMLARALRGDWAILMAGWTRRVASTAMAMPAERLGTGEERAGTNEMQAGARGTTRPQSDERVNPGA